jgi:hypothetical protein
MTAATADREALSQNERTRAHPVAAATTIYKGVAVALNASGYAVLLTDSAAVKFAGIAIEGVINTTAEGFGSAGDLNVRVATRGVHAMVSSGLALGNSGADLYWADNQTVQLAPTTQYAGKLARYTSATEARVDIAPAILRAESEATGSDLGDFALVGVAANKSVTASVGVALDADGFLVDMDDSTAVSFWGVSMEAGDNTGGSDGDISVWVARSGKVTLASSGLAAANEGAEVWQATDAVTVSLTPGDILVGHIEEFLSATSCSVRFKPMPIVGQRTERRFQIDATYIGAVGNSGVVALEDLEFDRKYVVIGGYADAQTAPGSGYQCDIDLDDGTTQFTVVIDDTATHGENKTPAPTSPMKTTDTDVTLVDDNASGATADVKAHFECEYL